MARNRFDPFRPVVLHLNVHVLWAEGDERLALGRAMARIEFSFWQFTHGASDGVAAFSGVPTGVGHTRRHWLVETDDVLRLLAGFLKGL